MVSQTGDLQALAAVLRAARRVAKLDYDWVNSRPRQCRYVGRRIQPVVLDQGATGLTGPPLSTPIAECGPEGTAVR